MGMVLVAFLAANEDGVSVATIRSTLRRTKSAASSGSRLVPLLSANRCSMVIFLPSIQPNLLNSCRNAAKSPAIPEAVLESRKPMRTTFRVCCAHADEQGAKSMEHRAKSKAPSVRIVAFMFIFVFGFVLVCPLFNFSFLIFNFLPDHLICPIEHRLWNCHADLLRCFQIDHQLKFCRLLDRKVGGLAAFENSVDIVREPPVRLL